MTKQQQLGTFGGLVGAALGGTAWMAITPFAARWSVSGKILALACVAAVWLTLPVLWRLRCRLRPMQSAQVLLSVTFLATLTFLAVAHHMQLPLLRSWPPPVYAEAAGYFGMLLIFPVLAAFTWYVDRRQQEIGASGGNRDHPNL